MPFLIRNKTNNSYVKVKVGSSYVYAMFETESEAYEFAKNLGIEDFDILLVEFKEQEEPLEQPQGDMFLVIETDSWEQCIDILKSFGYSDIYTDRIKTTTQENVHLIIARIDSDHLPQIIAEVYEIEANILLVYCLPELYTAFMINNKVVSFEELMRSIPKELLINLGVVYTLE